MIYIGEDITLSNGVLLKYLDICNFEHIQPTSVSNDEYKVFLDRTDESIGSLYYDKHNSQFFKPLAEWREEQIDKILADD